MDFIASFYPALSERRLYPALYLPSCFILTLLPFLLPNRRLSVVATFPILLFLCVRAPFYTFGDASSNYYNSGTFPAMVFWYIDFLVITPAKGTGAPVFLGDTSKERNAVHQPRSLNDNTTSMQKLRWAARLMIPPVCTLTLKIGLLHM